MKRDAIMGGLVGLGMGTLIGASLELADALNQPIKHQIDLWPGRRRQQVQGDGVDLVQHLGAQVVQRQGLGAGMNARGLEAARWTLLHSEGADMAADPAPWHDAVQGFINLMATCERGLARMQDQVRALGVAIQRAGVTSPDPRWRMARAAGQLYAQLRKRFQVLSDGFWQYAVPAASAPQQQRLQGEQLGAWQVVAVVAGVAVGVGAIAWAVVGYQDARALRDEIALQGQELQARLDAMRQGRTLQPSTLPTPRPTDPPPNSAGLPPEVIAAGAAIAVGLVGLQLSKES